MTAASGAKRVLNVVNDFLHLPVVEPFFFYLFWAGHLILSPLYAIGLLVIGLIEAITGAWIRNFDEPRGRYILVTGCDSGFGHDLVLSLYEKGWKVFAGCLTEEGMRRVRELTGEGVIPIKLDVTKKEDIEKAVVIVDRESPEGLYALVNNAGVATAGAVDWAPIEDFRFIMEVNYFAVISMTKAFLPALKKTPGGSARVVNVGSLAGLMMGGPFMSAYAASKHAVEALTSSLRVELRGWGIQVVGVNPAFHRTAIAHSASINLDRTFRKLPQDRQAEYGERYLKVAQYMTAVATDGCWDPKHVNTALLHAVAGRRSKEQYLVGMDCQYAAPIMMLVPVAWLAKISYWLFSELSPAAVYKRKRAEAEQTKKVKAQ